MFGYNINEYELNCVIKQTKSSNVHLARHRQTGALMVIKQSIDKNWDEIQMIEVNFGRENFIEKIVNFLLLF